jgi:hypothetical protein
MNLKLHEVIALFYELNGMTKEDGEVLSQGLLKQKMSLKVKVYLQRLNNAVAEDIKLYEEARKELFKKYGTEEDGKISISGGENLEGFNKEHNDLLQADKTIDVATLWGSDLTLDSLSNIETDEFYPLVFKLVDEKK